MIDWKNSNLFVVYIVKKYLKYFFTTLFILLGIIWLTRIVKFIDLLTVNNMKLADFFLLSILLLPTLFDFLLPIIAIIAISFTFNNLINNRELYVFKSSGLNNFILLRPFIYCFTFFLVIHYLFSFIIVPFSYQKISDMKRDVASIILTSVLSESSFNMLDNNLVIYVDKKDEGSVYNDLIAIQYLKNNKYNFIYSDKAKIIKKENNLLLGLNNGKRLLVDYDNDQIENVEFSKYITDLDFFNENEKLSKPQKKISALYIWEFFKKTDLTLYDSKNLKNEFHHRVIWPSFSFVISFFLVIFYLKSSFRRQNNLYNNIYFFSLSLLLIIFYFVFREYFLSRNDLVILLYSYIMLILLYSLYSNLNTLKKG